jgi:hypothetical protein
MKTATKIVLTLSLSLGLAGCDQYWQQVTGADMLPAGANQITAGRTLPMPPAPHKDTIKGHNGAHPDPGPAGPHKNKVANPEGPGPLPPMPTNPHKNNIDNPDGPGGDPVWSPHVSEL